MFKIVVAFFISMNILAFSPGEKAPDFQLKGSDGKSHKLSDYQGKTVILEWYNYGCPYVRKHYDAGHMQKLQKKYKDKVVWLTISSSAPGKQGHLADIPSAKAKYIEENMSSTAILLDGNTGSKVGKTYQAKTTPHLYVIDKKGMLAYNGAIDSISSADSDDIEKATPLLANAIDAVLDEKQVPKAKNTPYGCSVKY